MWDLVYSLMFIVTVTYGIKPKYLDLQLFTTSEVNNDNVVPYQWFPIQIKTVALKVRAQRDARIAFSAKGKALEQPYMEILLGKDDNTNSCFQLNKQVVKKVGDDTPAVDGIFDTPDILDKFNFRSFWISWEDNNILKVGHWGSHLPFMTIKEPLNFEVNFIGVASAYGAEGLWKIEDQDDYLGHTINESLRYTIDYLFLMPVKFPSNGKFFIEVITTVNEKDNSRFSLHFKSSTVYDMGFVEFWPMPLHGAFWFSLTVQSGRVVPSLTDLNPVHPKNKIRHQVGAFSKPVKFLEFNGPMSKVKMIRLSINDYTKEYWLTPQATKAISFQKHECIPDVDLDKPYINLRGIKYAEPSEQQSHF